MKLEEMQELFERHSDEYLKFEDVRVKYSLRPDMHAFIVLDKLVPGNGRRDMISAAEHDEFWLDIEPEELASVATEEVILDLMRCGLRYDEETESLAFFA